MPASSGYELDTVRVMVVEDSRHMRQILKSLLHSLGITNITEAEDGTEAYQKLQSAEFDLIISDLMMEPMDGFTFVRKIRRSEDSPDPFLPVIILSGYTEKFRVKEARDAGVNEILAKPISAKELAAKIRAVIESPRPYIKSKTYFGPDRRRAKKSDMFYTGIERRTNMFAIEEQLKASGQADQRTASDMDDILDFDFDKNF